jgi:hypothetical protein
MRRLAGLHMCRPAGPYMYGPVDRSHATGPARHHLIEMSSVRANGSSAASPPGPRSWWRGLPASRRRLARILAGAAIFVVALVGVVLARWLSVENAERDDEVALVQAEARGDAASMLAKLSSCRASHACLATVEADAANPKLRRTGAVKILALSSPTAYSFSGATGRTRLAWTVIGTPPVVQCVTVRRTGNALSGVHVHLLAISAPIAGEGVCSKPSAFEQAEAEVGSSGGP